MNLSQFINMKYLQFTFLFSMHFEKTMECFPPESSLQWQWSIRGNRLDLGPVTLGHGGVYTCVAKNSEGQTQKDYALTVQGKVMV